MSISVLFNGITYSIPETGEESWGENLTSYFTAIPQGALQKTGGSFTLTADVNFGANYGLLSKYFSTRTALPSTAGVVRLAVTDSIGWRNNANGANLLLAVNGSNQLTFNGSVIYPGGITALTGDVTATGPGSVAATVAFVGSYSAANVAAGATLANAATSANTVSAIVKRDSSGNFVAGTITASLTGTASGNTTISANQYGVVLSGSANVLSVLAPDASTAKVLVSGGASANPAWSLLTNTNLSGSAAISNANLAAMASASSSVGTVKGNISGSSAVPSDIVLTSANTVSSVVYRDSSGNFSATTITAAVTGSASGNLSYSANQYGVLLSGSANVVSVLAPDASSAKVLISGGASANPAWSLIAAANISATAAIAFTQLASLTSTNILVGSSGNVATSVAMSGDITIGNTGVTAIGANKVTLAMMATVATATFLGRTTAATGNVEALTVTQATALLNNMVGDSGSGGTKGLVPAPAAGDAAAVKFLKADGTWQVPAGAGTVTSVAASGPSGIATWSAAVTGAGTLTQTLSTQTARTFFQGPASGSAATPTFAALTAPTVQTFLAAPTGATNYSFTITSGSATVGATYTNNGQTFTVLATIASAVLLFCSGTGTPGASGTLTKATGTGDATITFSAFNGCFVLPSGTTPLYIRVRILGGGGGGGASAGSTSTPGSGSTGGTSSFGTSFLTCLGGGGGLASGPDATTAGVGGVPTMNSPAVGTPMTGNSGGAGIGYNAASGSIDLSGGSGGPGPFGGCGAGGAQGNVGTAAIANSGAGGGGAGTNSGNLGKTPGAGGGSGAFIDCLVPSGLLPHYQVIIGAGGAAGTTGTNAVSGGAGGSGMAEVTIYYQ